MSHNSTPTAARLRLAPFGSGPAAHPAARETLAAVGLVSVKNTGFLSPMGPSCIDTSE
jgi:hypothetical protein